MRTGRLAGPVAATVALWLAGGGAVATTAAPPEASAHAERGSVAADGGTASKRRAARRCRGPARRRVRRSHRVRCARVKRLVGVAPVEERLVPRVRAEDAPPPPSGDPSGSTDPAPDGEPTGGPSPPPIRFASVAAAEWTLTLSRPVVGAGSVTIELQNVGEDPHNLVVSPDDGSHDPLEVWPETAPGDHLRRTLPLSRGRYYLWCSLEGHEASGMSVRLRVE
jgi:hypothetical protein